MKQIEIGILNPSTIKEAEKMMVCAARLTQRGHKIKTLNDFMNLYNREYDDKLIKGLLNLPHPTIQKLGVINVVVVGASRRFLAQITRHQNEVKFMSASLQYSDYSDSNDFTIPKSIINNPELVDLYLKSCKSSMDEYKELVNTFNIDNDAAGYMAPQGLRNVLIISATPYQWKHMVSQRVCRRNTEETRYVMLLIWNELCKHSDMFLNCGPFCMKDKCEEGKMSCGKIIDKTLTPKDILLEDFGDIYGG